MPMRSTTLCPDRKASPALRHARMDNERPAGRTLHMAVQLRVGDLHDAEGNVGVQGCSKWASIWILADSALVLAETPRP